MTTVAQVLTTFYAELDAPQTTGQLTNNPRPTRAEMMATLKRFVQPAERTGSRIECWASNWGLIREDTSRKPARNRKDGVYAKREYLITVKGGIVLRDLKAKTQPEPVTEPQPITPESDDHPFQRGDLVRVMHWMGYWAMGLYLRANKFLVFKTDGGRESWTSHVAEKPDHMKPFERELVKKGCATIQALYAAHVAYALPPVNMCTALVPWQSAPPQFAANYLRRFVVEQYPPAEFAPRPMFLEACPF